MIIVNLNIRGLRGATKTRYLTWIIACEGAKFICLQEKKKQVFFRMLGAFLCGGGC